MEWHIGGTRLEIHPLALLLPALAIALGLRMEAGVVLASLFVHEAAHLLAARLLRVRMDEIRLMPFGGQALMGNVYALSAAQLFGVAVAGPLASLGMVFIAAALAHWNALSPGIALEMINVNLALGLFNLLPALPLDGGRMLYAMTARKLGRSRAVEAGILLGRVAAAGLIAAALYGLIITKRLNVSLAACAVFLLSSAPEERRALSELQSTSPLNALREIRQPIGMRLCAVDSSCGLLSALRHTSSDAATLYAVYENDVFSTFTDERALLNAALRNHEGVVAEAL